MVRQQAEALATSEQAIFVARSQHEQLLQAVTALQAQSHAEPLRRRDEPRPSRPGSRTDLSDTAAERLNKSLSRLS